MLAKACLLLTLQVNISRNNSPLLNRIELARQLDYPQKYHPLKHKHQNVVHKHKKWEAQTFNVNQQEDIGNQHFCFMVMHDL